MCLTVLSSLDVSRTHEACRVDVLGGILVPLGATKATGLESLRARLGVPAAGDRGRRRERHQRHRDDRVGGPRRRDGGADEVHQCRSRTAAVENDGAAAVMHRDYAPLRLLAAER